MCLLGIFAEFLYNLSNIPVYHCQVLEALESLSIALTPCIHKVWMYTKTQTKIELDKNNYFVSSLFLKILLKISLFRHQPTDESLMSRSPYSLMHGPPSCY